MRSRLAILAPIALAAVASGCTTSDIEGTLYGETLTLTETTPIADIVADPDAWVGQRVLVEATVVDVCDKRGCWIDLASEREFETIRIKVDEGVIAFPMSAKGLHARAEGVVEKLTFTQQEALERARHHAEVHDEEFDPASVTGPEIIYQIKAIGVVIEDQP
jgi:hypothetical protein